MAEDRGRNWNSVCADCVHFANGCCAAFNWEADERDSFAAVCEYFARRGCLCAALEGSPSASPEWTCGEV